MTIKGNIETLNGPKEAIPNSITLHNDPKETIEGSKMSFAGNVGTINGPYRTIDGSM